MVYWIALVKEYNCYRFRQHSLTLVNKQIRSESLPILYGHGLFSIYFFVCRWFHSFERIQRSRPIPPAMSNLTCITKLDIRFEIDFTWFSGGSDLGVHMRKDESDGESLLNKKLVGRPGLDWKDRASIKAVYDSFMVDLQMAHYPSYWSLAEQVGALRKGTDVVVEGLLFFAEKCPAAAGWVWMTLKAPNRTI